MSTDWMNFRNMEEPESPPDREDNYSSLTGQIKCKFNSAPARAQTSLDKE